MNLWNYGVTVVLQMKPVSHSLMLIGSLDLRRCLIGTLKALIEKVEAVMKMKSIYVFSAQNNLYKIGVSGNVEKRLCIISK